MGVTNFIPPNKHMKQFVLSGMTPNETCGGGIRFRERLHVTAESIQS